MEEYMLKFKLAGEDIMRIAYASIEELLECILTPIEEQPEVIEIYSEDNRVYITIKRDMKTGLFRILVIRGNKEIDSIETKLN